MKIDEALRVLSERRHRGSDRWQRVGGLRAVKVKPSEDTPSAGWLTEFEAVAIAEKYEREKRAKR